MSAAGPVVKERAGCSQVVLASVDSAGSTGPVIVLSFALLFRTVAVSSAQVAMHSETSGLQSV